MKTKITLILVLLICGCGLPAFAQGTAFTYQGRLTEGAAPATGLYDLRFAIYDAASGGAQQGPLLTNSPTGVTNGLFTAALDFGNRFPGAARWLEIGVRSSGSGAFTTLSPRQALTPAPYAIAAGSSSNLLGTVSATQLTGSISPGNIGAGSITAAMLAPGAVSSLGAPDGSPTNALIVDTNGLVGIGVAHPTAGLQIGNVATQSVLDLKYQASNGEGGYTNLYYPHTTAVKGDLVAIGAYGGITLVDIRVPASPSRRAQFGPATASVFTNLVDIQSVAWAGSNLVAASGISNAITLIGCTNPASPVKLAEIRDGLGGWNHLAGIKSVAVSGSLLAIAAEDAVTLADISNPSAPVLRSTMVNGSFGFTNLAGARSVALSGNLLAIGASGSSAVTLVNVADPANPQKLAEIRQDVGGYTNLLALHTVVLSGNLLAIGTLNSSSITGHGVTLVDVSDPSNPVKLSIITDAPGEYGIGAAWSVAISGNWLVTGGYNTWTLSLFDIGNPTNPVKLSDSRQGRAGAYHLDPPTGLSFSGTNVIACAQDSDAFTVFSVFPQSVGLGSAGWVGIGTSYPKAALHVVGDVVVEGGELFDVNASSVKLGYGRASGPASTSLGGGIASGDHSTAMGYFTTASGQHSTAMGYSTTASGDYSTAMGEETIAAGKDSLAGGYQSHATGWASTAIGYAAWATNAAATGFGQAVMAGGRYSMAVGNYSKALGDYSAVSGGTDNIVQTNSPCGAIGGGSNNVILANSSCASIPGGQLNAATNFALAAGRRAKAVHTGSFVWADSTDADFSSTAANQFNLRATGGVRVSDNTPGLYFGTTPRQMLNLWSTNFAIGVQDSTTYFRSDSGFAWHRGGQHASSGPGSGGSTLMTLTGGGLTVNGTFVSGSDRDTKEDFAPVDAQAVLAKVAALPLQSWSYTNNPGVKHVGPMAQDFHAAFGLNGSDDKHIATVDADGVALAAIQGLNQKLEQQLQQKDAELKSQQQQIGALLERLNALEGRLSRPATK